uniref:Pco072468 n=1 Tax=Arundo donax TaxID=35708 RepID=A0A0A9FR84_ARUDO
MSRCFTSPVSIFPSLYSFFMRSSSSSSSRKKFRYLIGTSTSRLAPSFLWSSFEAWPPEKA